MIKNFIISKIILKKCKNYKKFKKKNQNFKISKKNVIKICNKF